MVKCINHGKIKPEELKLSTVEQVNSFLNKVFEAIPDDMLNTKSCLYFRWRSEVQCLSNLIINEQPLRCITTESDPETIKALTKDSALPLFNDDFWKKIAGLQELLSLIAVAINEVEGNDPMLSSSVRLFSSIEFDFRNTEKKVEYAKYIRIRDV